ncbi:MAG: hypothetical protein HYR59_05150 [Acidobacteria bacterium]|nr:hypothetical protein [Acidobacteriota bacterium]
MSEFANDEARRLKDVLGAKRVEKERSVQEHQIKQNQGLSFWQETREEAKRIIDALNKNLGKDLFLWRSANSNEIDVIASEVGQEYNIQAVFKSDQFNVAWHAPRNRSQHKLTLFVERDKLFWNDGSDNMTAQQAAEEIISTLTKSIA